MERLRVDLASGEEGLAIRVARIGLGAAEYHSVEAVPVVKHVGALSNSPGSRRRISIQKRK